MEKILNCVDFALFSLRLDAVEYPSSLCVTWPVSSGTEMAEGRTMLLLVCFCFDLPLGNG